jgi:hypothetical protein
LSTGGKFSVSVELPQLSRPSNHHYFHRLKPKSHIPTTVHILQAQCLLKPPLFFIHHPLLFQSTKKMSDNPIKFPSSPSSSKDELPSHHSFKENVSFDDEMSDYSPPWSSEKEDPEEDEDDVDIDVKGDEDDSDDNSDDSDFVSNFASPPPK